MSHIVFNPPKKQYYLAQKLDFQESSPKKQQDDDGYHPKQRLTLHLGLDPLSEFQASKRTKSSLQPLNFDSTKEQTGLSFKYTPEEVVEIGPNIFKDLDNAQRKKYTDYNIGPKYDAEGNVVRWSLLGKPDQFTRIQNQKKKGVSIGLFQQSQKKLGSPNNKSPTNKMKSSIMNNKDINNLSINPDDQSKVLRTQQTNSSQQNQQASVCSDNNLRLQTATTTGKLSPKKGSSKKHRSEFKLVPKSELLNYMTTVESRLRENEQLDDSFTKNLAINMRNIVTREGRVIEKFDQQLVEWTSQKNTLSANCSRQVREALLSRAEGFRKRVENIKGVECTKSDYEKYSNRFWYLHLRKYKDNPMTSVSSQGNTRRAQFDLTTTVNHRDIDRVESRVQNRFVHDQEAEKLFKTQEFIVTDIFSGFQTKVVDNPNLQIEIVKKPMLGNNPSAPLFSTKFHRLFEQKIKQHPQSLKGKQAMVDDQESEFLIVEGKSVYEKELENLQNDGGPLVAQYQKHDIDKDISDDLKKAKLRVEEEVFAEQWDTRALSKTGEHFYPNLVKVRK